MWIVLGVFLINFQMRVVNRLSETAGELNMHWAGI